MKANPRLMVILGVFFVSFSAILIRLSEAPPLIIAFHRLAFTVVLLSPRFIVMQVTDSRTSSGRDSTQPGHDGISSIEAEAPASDFEDRDSITNKIQKRPVKDILLCILSGFFLSLHFTSWITSLSYTTIANATVLVNTQPIFVAIFSIIILKEHISPRSWLLIIIAFGGSIILTFGGQSRGDTSLFGNILALSGAVTVAGYMILGRILRQRMSLNNYTFIVYLSAACFLALYAVLSGLSFFSYPFYEYVIFLGLAIFPTLLGHSIFNWALKYLRPSLISMAILGEPLGSAILAVIIFSEIPSAWAFLGGAIILLSLYFFVKGKAREERLR